MTVIAKKNKAVVFMIKFTGTTEEVLKLLKNAIKRYGGKNEIELLIKQ